MLSRPLHSQRKSQLIKIAWITAFWMLISILQFLSNYSTVIQFDCDLANLNPSRLLQASMITGLTAGLIGGSTIVFFWEKWLRTRSYGWSLLNIFWTYTLIYMVVAVIGGLFFHSAQQNLPIFHRDIVQTSWTHFVSFSQAQTYLYWLFIVIVTLIALLVNDKYGPGVFASFVLGKYFHPKREERIFMFLDLRGSTTIAEKLGESLYFNFLRDLFKDATPGILNSDGEIYQYVGDEIVVSWKQEYGTFHANCLQCFFDIQKRFLDRASYYQQTYNDVTPEFKAGLHGGFVMVGEIGIVKRDIAYSGDVLNTTARIQSKCNELGVDILISRYLLEKLKSLPDKFKTSAIGELPLRGKQQSVMLYTVG